MTESVVTVEVLRDWVPVVYPGGLVGEPQKGEIVTILTSDAERHLPYGHVRLVEGNPKPAPTGDEPQVDKGEAGGMDAAAPLSKKDLLAALKTAGIEHDKRWSAAKLQEALDASLDR